MRVIGNSSRLNMTPGFLPHYALVVSAARVAQREPEHNS